MEMKKYQLLLWSFLFTFMGVSCSKDEAVKETIVYVSKPQVTMSAEKDSLFIEGYNTCTVVDELKGKMPASLAKEFGLDDRYTYSINWVVTYARYDKNYLLACDFNGGGYADKEFLIRNSMFSVSETKDKAQNYVSIASYFVHITEGPEGERDRWIPFPPDKLYWKCRLLDIDNIK